MVDQPPLATNKTSDQADQDLALDALRKILLDHERQQITDLEGDVQDLQNRVADKNRLIALISPVLGHAIRQNILNAREEMIEALYPIIGQLVIRAVGESIRDLARSIDSRMRKTLSLQAMWRRLQARLRGVSREDISLREALPFSIVHILVIHRETGLLIQHLLHDSATSSDSDLVSGMLTAIRDFVHDAFGSSQDGQLDEIQYGDRRILIEASQFVYMAIVVNGIEPPGFRAAMRERLLGIQNEHQSALETYDGNAAPFDSIKETLVPLLADASIEPINSISRRTMGWILASMVILIIFCIGSAIFATSWIWRVENRLNALTVVSPTVTATATATWTPTWTSMPTWTATARPTHTPTARPTHTPTTTPTWTFTATSTPTPTHTLTSTPTATPFPTATRGLVLGVLTGAWMYEEPSTSSEQVSTITRRGEVIGILEVSGNWVKIVLQRGEIVGWVPLTWVGVTTPIPPEIITPTPSSGQ